MLQCGSRGSIKIMEVAYLIKWGSLLENTDPAEYFSEYFCSAGHLPIALLPLSPPPTSPVGSPSTPECFLAHLSASSFISSVSLYVKENTPTANCEHVLCYLFITFIMYFL